MIPAADSEGSCLDLMSRIRGAMGLNHVQDDETVLEAVRQLAAGRTRQELVEIAANAERASTLDVMRRAVGIRRPNA